jgi:hypothetical protein
MCETQQVIMLRDRAAMSEIIRLFHKKLFVRLQNIEIGLTFDDKQGLLTCMSQLKKTAAETSTAHQNNNN